VLIVSQNTTITQYIRDYLKTWQHTKPSATGKTLKKLGLQPGPIYSRILDRLQTAWLDGEIHSQIEEDTLLEQLVREYNDDNSRTHHL